MGVQDHLQVVRAREFQTKWGVARVRAAEATTTSNHKNARRLPSSTLAHAATIIGDGFQARQTDREARATATFVIQFVTGSPGKADILDHPG